MGELPNGCLCCSAKDGLISALDNLLVEATGIADPESICEIFWVDDELGSRVYLDSIVTLVDCHNVLSALGELGLSAEPSAAVAAPAGGGGDMGMLGLEAESAKQVACADVLILNKMDLVGSSDARRAIADRVRRINPAATQIESTRSIVPLGDILGIRAFDRGQLSSSLENLEKQLVAVQQPIPMSVSSVESVSGHVLGLADAWRSGKAKASGHIKAPAHGIESLLLR